MEVTIFETETLIDAGRLRDVLKTLSPHVKDSPLVPAYSAVRLAIVKGFLMATAGGEMCRMTIQVAAIGGDEWSVCPELRPLASFLATLPAQPLRLEATDKALTIHYQVGKKWNSAVFPAFPGRDYPNPKSDHGVMIPVPKGLSAPLRKLLPFCRLDTDFFPDRAGIWFDVMNDTISLVGWDGTFIAEELVDHEAESKSLHQFILPHWGVTPLADSLDLAGKEDKLELSLGESWITMWFPGVSIQIRRLDAKRPSFEQLWPDHEGATFTVDRRDMLASLRRAKTIPHMSGSPIGFYPGTESISLKGAYNDYRFDEELPQQIDPAYNQHREALGRVEPFGLEPNKFELALKIFEGEIQKIRVTPRRAVLMTTDDDKRRILFMPMILPNF